MLNGCMNDYEHVRVNTHMSLLSMLCVCAAPGGWCNYKCAFLHLRTFLKMCMCVCLNVLVGLCLSLCVPVDERYMNLCT